MDNDTLQAALAAWAADEYNDAGVSATSKLSESGESSNCNGVQAADSHESADSDHLHPNADSDSSSRSVAVTFDAEAFLKGLDAIFEAHEGATKAEPYLLQAMDDAENAGDDAGLLTVLNETMGFYRSQGRHDDNQWIVQRSIELALRMRLEGTEAWTTTLINAATSMRAAGRYDQAEDLYRQAVDSAKTTLSPTDRRLAALHNNLSMLYSETGRAVEAERELNEALHVLEAASTDPSRDIDIAATHTNLALMLLEHPDDAIDEAMAHARLSLDIYRNAGQEHAGHYASALAGYAQVCLAAGDAAGAVAGYRQALDVISDNYGRDNDYYRITAANLVEAERTAERTTSADAHAAASEHVAAPSGNPDGAATKTARNSTVEFVQAGQDDRMGRNANAPAISGLKLARAYWSEYGKPLIAERYPEYQSRIAAGLVGHGSECYGFDDALSHDHDFGPGFCLWLTDEDYAEVGERLQADYDALPATFMGVGPRESTARAQGAGRRVGVFAIGDFFESITGYRQAPAGDRPYEWLMLDEPTLAAATNGEVFADPLGAFSKTRQGFKLMPEDVRLSLISRRLGMIAQAGQYNLPRMLSRGDGAAAWCSINEFAEAATSLVFLINQPISVGYAPYYKWRFAALRRLSRRMAARLPDICQQLETVLRLSSAACFGGAGFGEGGKGAEPAAERITGIVEHICAQIVHELKAEGLTSSDERFLEWQRPYVEAHIHSQDPCLHSL